MLIPIGHEQTSVRRIPIITLAIILFNCIVFLFTNADGSLDRQLRALAILRIHIGILAATDPDLQMTPTEKEVAADLRDHYPNMWSRFSDPKREPYDEWDGRMRGIDDHRMLQREMNSLAQQFDAALAASPAATQYAFLTAHPALISYFTSIFMHGGWLHLSFNMWFLWLAGTVLEDVWGRMLYPVFYLVGGAVANQMHAWANPGSWGSAIGASGAVAALMGAFLIRFPKMKIEMIWLLSPFSFFRLFRPYRFKAHAYWLLLLWLLVEVFYGTLLGPGSPVAHWAHIGGFAFGAVVALSLRYSGLEHTVGDVVEKPRSVSSAKEIQEARQLLERGRYDDARNILNAVLAKSPDSIDVLEMLRDVSRRRAGDAAYLDITAKLCSAYLKEKDFEAAWQEYRNYLKAGGRKLPAAVWLSLCRSLEEQQKFEAALEEYEELIAGHPEERQSLMAQLQAAGLCLSKLNRPQDALKFYEEAAASPIPHLDLDATIQMGIRSANKALTGSRTSAASGG